MEFGKKETALLLALVFLISGGCAKKKNDISQVKPEQLISKADLTGCPPGKASPSCEKIYSNVRTVMAANEELAGEGIIPGTHLDLGLVKLVVTEKALLVVR